MKYAYLLVAVICLVAAAPVRSQSQAPTEPQSQQGDQSLGDAARKAKAEKSKSTPAKVYTQDDLSHLPSSGVSVVGQKASTTSTSQESPGAGAESKADASTKAADNEEAYWRGEARKLLDQMATVDKEIAKVKDDIKKYGSGGFDTSTGLADNVIYVQDRNSELQDLQKKKEGLEKQMDALQEAGRKAGAPASWFR